jgi:hypothetical protein
MMDDLLKASHVVTLRHLAASRYYLPTELSSGEANAVWESMQNYLHHNELGLALEDAIDLGDISGGDKQYWKELYLAAQSMNLSDVMEALRARL